MQPVKNATAAAKEKMSDMAASTKEKVDKAKASAEEKVRKSTAHTKGEKEIVHQDKEAKESEAEMRKHAAKAENKAERENEKHLHHRAGAGVMDPTHTTTYPSTTTTPPGKYL